MFSDDGTGAVPGPANGVKREWIEICQDRTGEIGERGHWYWCLWGKDDELLCSGASEGFPSERACVAAATRARVAMGCHPWMVRSNVDQN